jgi:cyclic pyranopterin phosphate synthase
MAEDMSFLPKKEILSFAEIETIATAFVTRGRDTVATDRRRAAGAARYYRAGAQPWPAYRAWAGRADHDHQWQPLAKHAEALVEAGMRRINVSLDTLDKERFTAITRRGRLEDVMGGIDAAQAAGLKIKINMVAMRGVNDDEIEPMMAWAHGRGMGLTLIEGMPLGEVGIDRVDSYLPLRELRDRLAKRYTLEKLDHRTGGPARYARVAETGGMLGFITPMSHNFCESCNRVRLTATGQLFLCLGQEDQVNLRDALRDGGAEALDAALDQAMLIKPKGHDFVIDRARPEPALGRHMSVTGG